jgi:hypothetical protein
VSMARLIADFASPYSTDRGADDGAQAIPLSAREKLKRDCRRRGVLCRRRSLANYRGRLSPSTRAVGKSAAIPSTLPATPAPTTAKIPTIHFADAFIALLFSCGSWPIGPS